MKAVVYTEYGSADVLKLKEVPKPMPGENEVLIKVHASSVTTGDVNMRGFTFVPPGFGFLPRLMFGLRRPRKTILGAEVAGVIESTGRNVTLFKPGEAVFGINSREVGAYAEYVCWSAKSALAPKPATITYEQAAAVPFGASTALYFLRDLAKIQPGQKVLVHGASGGVGVYAVQLAKYYGAEVTAICSTANMDLIRSLGADKVVDYTKEDFRKYGVTYDVIFDTVVGKTSFSAYEKSLNPKGSYLAVAGGLREMRQMAWNSVRRGKKVLAGSGSERREDLLFVSELIEAGKLQPVIDRRFSLEEIADAHRYVDRGRKRGSVVIAVASP